MGPGEDEERRRARNEARGAVNQRTAGRASGDAKRLKHARYALWRGPEDLTERQAEKLAWIAKTDPRLHRAYLLKGALRSVPGQGRGRQQALDRWIVSSRSCRIPAFVELHATSSNEGCGSSKSSS